MDHSSYLRVTSYSVKKAEAGMGRAGLDCWSHNLKAEIDQISQDIFFMELLDF